MRSCSVSSCSCSTVSGVFSSCAASDRNSSRRRIASSALARLQALLSEAAALGQIARHLGEADQLAVLGAQRGDDHVRPELRAVLADAPALVLEPAVARRALQLALALAGADLLVVVELREVVADDLARLVALDPLGAGVPGHDAAARVEHEDRVVLDRLDQQAEARLALAQLVLRERGQVDVLAAAPRAPVRASAACATAATVGDARQRKRERRAVRLARRDRDVAAVRLGDPLGDEQTQSQAARSSRRRWPPVSGSKIWVTSAGGIAPMLCTCTRTTSGTRPVDEDPDAGGGNAVLERVRDQVREHLAQSIGVPAAARVARLADIDGAVGIAVVQLVHHLSRQRRQVGVPRFDGDAAAHAQPREIQQLLDHPRHALAAGHEAPQRLRVAASGAAASRFLISSAAVMIAASGARRSCASTPMNSSLTRIVSLSSSASCLARAARSRSAAWARFSSCTELRKAVSTCLRRAISAARSRDVASAGRRRRSPRTRPCFRRAARDRDVRVLAADLADARAGRPVGERRHRVGAQQIERIDGAEIGPHLLERDRGGVIRALPQEVDHLAVGAHLHPPLAARADGFDEAAHDPREQLSIGGIADHELLQRRRRVQDREIAGEALGLDVDVHGREASDELLAVRLATR